MEALITALIFFFQPLILPGWTIETTFEDIEAPYQAESHAEPSYLRLMLTFDVEQIEEDGDDPADVVIHELVHGLFWQLQELAEEHNPEFAEYLADAAISQLEKVIRANIEPDLERILREVTWKAQRKVDEKPMDAGLRKGSPHEGFSDQERVAWTESFRDRSHGAGEKIDPRGSDGW